MFRVLVNNESLDINEYGEEKIRREAKYHLIGTNSLTQLKAQFQVNQAKLEDETSLWQFASSEEITFHEISDFVEE